MSYRNDHDAAVARVDALTSENSQLAAENARLRKGMTIVVPQAERAVSRGAAAVVLAALTGAGILAAVVMTDVRHAAPTLHDESTPHDDSPAVRAIDPEALRACARTLELAPVAANAKASDPHGKHQDIAAVLRSTGCRAEIRDVLDYTEISNEEHTALEKWSNAEARLEASVSMVGEYYAHDPYALDGYSSAPQLWTEFNRALVIRNQALAEWRKASH